MADTNSVKLDTKALDEIVRTLSSTAPYAKVGILGDKNARTEGKKTLTFNEVKGLTKKIKHGAISLTNAEIGASHEFGDPTRGLPQRSFLRVPITEKVPGAFESLPDSKVKEMFNRVVSEKSLLPWVKTLAVLAEGVVQQAFATGGFGKWPKWKKGYINNTGQILVDTQQLRNSISSEIVGGS